MQQKTQLICHKNIRNKKEKGKKQQQLQQKHQQQKFLHEKHLGSHMNKISRISFCNYIF